MNDLIRSEVRKLATTNWFKITLAAAFVLAPLSAVSNALAGGTKSLATLGTPDSIHHVLAAAALTSMVMLAVGISAIAGEYRHSTSIPTFLITPRRRDVLIAKLITVTALGAIVGAVGFGLSLAAAVPALSSRGVHHLAGDTPQMWVGCVIVSALFGALGVALGALTRSTVVAIIGAIGWAVLIEVGLLANLAPAVGKWLPTGANIAISRTVSHPELLLPPVVATVVLIAWTALLAGTATRFVLRREI